MQRLLLLPVFGLALAVAQFRESGLPGLAGHLEIVTGMPARVYLFKDGRPFRLSPVDALLPLKVDLFYRERLWRRTADPKTLEITCNEQSHFVLLAGSGAFDLPPGNYRVEAYRGTFYRPASQTFELKPRESKRVDLDLAPIDGPHEEWLAGDDHIHLTRAAEDDAVFLAWAQAEDLAVGNFLQLQRQMDAAVQYGFGRAGEARAPGYSIRPGHESRSAFYGHVNLLGGRELIRPLSVGVEYANSPEAYPFPQVLFDQGRAIGATVGYAHFDGSQKHSTLLMDLALGKIDFIEVFQFGVLKTEPWYELLNAGLRVTGIAGSDFPVPLNNRKPWPRSIPLLGPERTLVKAKAGESAYDAWAAGVREGRVVVTNGPLLELSVAGKEPGAEISWSGGTFTAEGVARAYWHRPVDKIEIVMNGKVVAETRGAGPLTFRVPLRESAWIAARTAAAPGEDEPEIVAHTNPVYCLRDGRPVALIEAREAVRKQWAIQAAYFRSPALSLNEEQRRELLRKVEETEARLR
jgi:hypothetical protein